MTEPLAERSEIGSITITADGHIEIRRDDFIVRGGEIVAGPTYHRYVLAPGDALDTVADPRIDAVAGAVWTDDVVAAHTARLEAKAKLAIAPGRAEAE